jgi:hypothetical protein
MHPPTFVAYGGFYIYWLKAQFVATERLSKVLRRICQWVINADMPSGRAKVRALMANLSLAFFSSFFIYPYFVTVRVR